jgi:putative peptidoglycan lipid II flippase
MNLAFVWQLRHAGLALAISLGACLNAGLLYYKLRRHEIFRPQPGWIVFLAKVAVALLAMSVVLWLLAGEDAFWLNSAVARRIGWLSIVVLAGVTTYFGSLWLLGLRLSHFARRSL